MQNSKMAARVALRFAASRPLKPEKMQELLLKIRKWSVGSLKIKNLVPVFDLLEWKLEEVPVYEPQGGLSIKTDKPIRFQTRNQDVAEDTWKKAKKNEVRALPNVSSTKIGDDYYLDVSEVTTDGTYWSVTYTHWSVVEGTRLSNSHGKSFNAPKATAQFYEDYVGSHREGLLALGLVDEVNKQLGLSETIEQEKARLKKVPRTRANTGTCPACFGNFKLVPKTKHGKDKAMPGMVLHGYQRPGDGRVEGNCFGQDWPPYELSLEGTKEFEAYVEKSIQRQKDAIADFKRDTKSGKIKELYDEYAKRPLSREHLGELEWERRVNSIIATYESRLAMTETDLRYVKGKISDWKVRPLPGEGEEIR